MKKENKEIVKDLIETITGSEARLIAVPIPLINYLGCPKKALVLAQIIYLSDKGKRPDGYIYKTYKEMYEEVGVKEGTLRRHFKEFKEFGFFDWKVKKANRFPTVHFKFNINRFTKVFRAFLKDRNRHNESNDSIKIAESLTQTTNIDITHSKKNPFSNDVIGENQNEVGDFVTSIKDETLIAGQNEMFLKIPKPVKIKIRLSSSFEPSLENKFWAISTYPQKSVSSATESFVAYHQEKNPEMERTKNEWQDSWRKWMQGQNDERGYNSKLEKEQNHIVLDTFGTIFKCISELFVQLHPRDSIYNLLCKENYNFSKKTVDAGLKHLESRGYIKRLFKDYYYAAECENETNGLSYEPDFQAIYCEYDEINPKIQKYISDNVVVHLDDLLSRCTDEHKDSLKLFLDIGVDCNFLFEIDGYYFDYLRFEDGQDGIREKINRKLESFGIKNPVEIDDEGGENPEVWGDDFYEGLADYTIPLIPEESEPADVFLV